jgi:hypothetical protein
MDLDLKLNSVCQCCLADHGFMKNMVSETYRDTKLIESFKTCLGIDLLADQTEVEDISKNICPKCELNFQISIEFHELCHTSQTILKERLNFVSDVKDEPVSDDEPLILYTQKPATETRRGGTNFTQVFVTNKSETDLKVKEDEDGVEPARRSVAGATIEIKVNTESPGNSQDEDDAAFFGTSEFTTNQDSDSETENPDESEIQDHDASGKIATMTAKYQCYHCDQYLSTHIEYVNHRENHIKYMNKVTENRQIDRTCFVCKKDVVSYVKHLRLEHIDFRPHECIQCNLTFRTQLSLREHLYSHVTQKLIKCMGCPLKFSKYETFLKIYER